MFNQTKSALIFIIEGAVIALFNSVILLLFIKFLGVDNIDNITNGVNGKLIILLSTLLIVILVFSRNKLTPTQTDSLEENKFLGKWKYVVRSSDEKWEHSGEMTIKFVNNVFEISGVRTSEVLDNTRTDVSRNWKADFIVQQGTNMFFTYKISERVSLGTREAFCSLTSNNDNLLIGEYKQFCLGKNYCKSNIRDLIGYITLTKI